MEILGHQAHTMTRTRTCNASNDAKHHWVRARVRDPFTHRLNTVYRCVCCNEKRWVKPYKRTTPVAPFIAPRTN